MRPVSVKSTRSVCTEISLCWHNRLDVRSRTSDILTLLSATIDPRPHHSQPTRRRFSAVLAFQGCCLFLRHFSICNSTLGSPDHIPPRYSWNRYWSGCKLRTYPRLNPTLGWSVLLVTQRRDCRHQCISNPVSTTTVKLPPPPPPPPPHHHKGIPLLFAPGNSFPNASHNGTPSLVISSNCGQAKLSNGAVSASVNIFNGSNTDSKILFK